MHELHFMFRAEGTHGDTLQAKYYFIRLRYRYRRYGYYEFNQYTIERGPSRNAGMRFEPIISVMLTNIRMNANETPIVCFLL